MVDRPAARKTAMSKLVRRMPQPLQPLAYLGCHTFAAWLALLPTKIWFDHQWAHTAILLVVVLWSFVNGSNYYFKARRGVCAEPPHLLLPITLISA